MVESTHAEQLHARVVPAWVVFALLNVLRPRQHSTKIQKKKNNFIGKSKTDRLMREGIRLHRLL